MIYIDAIDYFRQVSPKLLYPISHFDSICYVMEVNYYFQNLFSYKNVCIWLKNVVITEISLSHISTSLNKC